MEIVITEWALDSYLNLVALQVFSTQEYKGVIRPDVERLKTYPSDQKFQSHKFWSQAQDPQGGLICDGFKMKWHNVGNGKVQLRLPVALLNVSVRESMLNSAVLCEAYVKQNAKQERRLLAKFKTHLELIRRGRHTVRGRLP